MFNSPISKTQEQLVQAAREATSDYITNGTDLTEAVVKAASSITPVTSEHVRRICEMTYHDAYERSFAEKTGMYQYVSFDPPDAIRAAEMLDALQLGFSNQENFDKLAMTKEAGLKNYFDVMRGKNVSNASDAVDSARTAIDANKRKLNDLAERYKTTRQALDDANTGYSNHKQDLDLIYKDRAELLRKLGISTKNNVRGTQTPTLHREARKKVKKDPSLQTQFDALYGQDAIDRIDTSNQAITKIQQYQKQLSHNLTAIKDSQKTRSNAKSSLQDRLTAATDDLGAQKNRTTKYRVGTGAAVSVPAGIGIYTYGKHKEKKNDPYQKFARQGVQKTAGIGDYFRRLTGKNIDKARSHLEDTQQAHTSISNEINRLMGIRDTSTDIAERKAINDKLKSLLPEHGQLGTDVNKAHTELQFSKDRTARTRLNTAIGAVPVALGAGYGIGKSRGKDNMEQSKQANSISMPRKFQRMNTHELWTKAASGQELQDHNPTRELQQVHRDLKDSISTVKSELYSAEHNEKLAMIDMVKQAKAGLSAGHSMEQVLHAAVSVVDATEPFMAKTAHDLCATIIEACADHQNSGLSKTAGLGDVFNPSKSKNPETRYKAEYRKSNDMVHGGKLLGQFRSPTKGRTSMDEYVSRRKKGMSHDKALKKEAGALQEVNPDHPIPQKFKKLAEASMQRKHLEVTLDELNNNMAYYNQRLIDDLTR